MYEKNTKLGTENFLKENFNNTFVVDISCLPFLKTILSSMTDYQSKKPNEQTLTVCFPSILKKLIEKGEENRQYYAYFFNLTRRWTKKEIDITLLQNLTRIEKYENISIKWITSDDVKKSPLYSYSLEKFKDDDLFTRFSPEVNILGEFLGEILGHADEYGSYILMAGNHLVTEMKNHLSVFLNAVNEFQDVKTGFFSQYIPGLLMLSGVRWGIGIVSNLFTFSKGEKRKFSIPTFALSIFDP